MTASDYHGFVWSSNSGLGLSNQRGYLVFAATATNSTGTTLTTKCTAEKFAAATSLQVIAGHAFEYNLSAKDVAYVPVIDGPLTITAGVSMNNIGATDITAVAGAAQTGPSTKMFLRYYIDGTVNSGDDTRIAVWSTGNHAKTYTVDMLNDAQDRKSVNFTLTRKELDFVDPETIVGREAAHKDGFIEWSVPSLTSELTTNTTAAGSVFSFSVISAPAFGAVQSILNPHTKSGL